MKRFSSAAAPVLFSFFVLAAFARCIPSPDTSGLPPYDAGLYTVDSAVVIPSGDSGSGDATIIATDAGVDASSEDAAPQLGTVSGIVIDFTAGNGQGVVPGAVISLSYPSGVAVPGTLPSQVMSDSNGLFSIANVPASAVPLQIGVTKPTDLVNGIAYSTTVLVTTVGAGQTVNVFPVLHEGCFLTTTTLSGLGEDGGSQPATLANATCASGVSEASLGSYRRPGAYAAMTFGPQSFSYAGTIYTGGIRIEMIPLAYPLNANSVSDLSWAIGLPGASAPAGLLGAAEYRVVKANTGADGGVGADDGELLSLYTGASASPVTIAVPVYAAPSAQAATASYSISTASWISETVLPSAVADDAGADQSPPIEYVTIQVPHLTWWGITSGQAPSTCVTGTLQVQGGGTPANVLVRAAGLGYLGTSTTQTGSGGVFCLDVTAGAEDAGGGVELFAGALSGGIAYSATYASTVTAGTGSCASGDGGAGCMPLGTITLTPTLNCVSGTVSASTEGTVPPLPASLEVTLVDLPVTDSASSVGIRDYAYVGETTLGDGGAFCGLVPPGVGFELYDPSSGCSAPPPEYVQDSPIEVVGTGGLSCGGTGCLDAGPQTFGCPLPP